MFELLFPLKCNLSYNKLSLAFSYILFEAFIHFGGTKGKIILDIMNHFSLASLSRNPMIIFLKQTMTFSKEAYQILKINNEKVSFRLPQGRYCTKGKNVCFVLICSPSEVQQLVSSETATSVVMWDQGSYTTLAPGTVFLETSWGRHLSPSPNIHGDRCVKHRDW